MRRTYRNNLGLLHTAISRKVVGKNVHATMAKGIVGGFELTVFQKNFKEWHKGP